MSRKVITSQYFIWYISLIPLIYENLRNSNKIRLLLITGKFQINIMKISTAIFRKHFHLTLHDIVFMKKF